MPNPAETPALVRLDKWLWAARFYKTRSLAVEQISKGRVTVNQAAAKASREVRVGDTIALHHDGRPTKRDRRDIERARHSWDDRWSASWDGN